MSKTDDNSIQISPNLLKNFNPFDILKPQRNVVEKLIDLDEPEINCNLNASLLDQKTEYELVDLYQNMYVTPQHLKVERDREPKDNDKNKNIDFKSFFDILESGKLVDWSNPEESAKNINDNDDLELTRKPKVKTPNVSNEDSDLEDLIAEVIATKNLEKLVLKEQNEVEYNTTGHSNLTKISNGIYEFSKPKVLNAPSNIDFKTLNINIQSSSKISFKSRDSNTDTDEARHFKKTQSENIEISSSELNNSICNCLFADQSTSQKVNSKIEGQIKNSPAFKVIAVKKDEKAYRKYHNSKPDSPKANFTKGADFNEKSIVLPQMMANIIARQEYLANNNNKKRRLILDSGVKVGVDDKLSNIKVKNNDKNISVDKLNVSANSESYKKCCNGSCKGTNRSTDTKPEDGQFATVSPKVLMADCNKERLKDLQLSRMFQQSIMNVKK